jgi:hypothetical protein
MQRINFLVYKRADENEKCIDCFKRYISKKLLEQIQSGKRLLAYSVNVLNDLETFKKSSKEWSKYNEELLKQSFSRPENDYKNEYRKCVLEIGVLGNQNLNEKTDEHKNKIKKKINCLESILKRIDLIPEK